MAYNYDNKDLQDKKVRQAIAKAINKEDFTKTLLNGNGSPAVGAFPSNFSFGNEAVKGDDYDLEAAKKAADYFVNSKWEHKYHLL